MSAIVEIFDVVVIGGGGSGLAAAIEAQAAGARTVLLEKSGKLGRSTACSIGSVTSTGTPHQQKQGIQDTPAEHFADMALFAGVDFGDHRNSRVSPDRQMRGLSRFFRQALQVGGGQVDKFDLVERPCCLHEQGWPDAVAPGIVLANVAKHNQRLDQMKCGACVQPGGAAEFGRKSGLELLDDCKTR